MNLKLFPAPAIKKNLDLCKYLSFTLFYLFAAFMKVTLKVACKELSTCL